MTMPEVMGAGWPNRAGLAHATIGIFMLFLTMHPLREALDAPSLALVQTMSTVQALNGVALAALATRLRGIWAPALIAGGVAMATAMIWVIAFTGAHPFDLAVPIGGMAMLAGWCLLLFQRGN